MGGLTIAILLGLAALTTQKPQNSNDLENLLQSPEIGSVLQDLIAQNSLGDSLGSASKHHSKHHDKHHYKHHDKKLVKNPNLMNIQNLNLVIKNNNLRKKPAQTEHDQVIEATNDPEQKALREIEDAICATTGRCGCSGGRCDDDQQNRAEDNNDLSKLLDSLQKDLESGQSSSSDLRCGCGNAQPQAGHYNLRCGCNKNRRPYKRTTKTDKDKVEHSEKIRINDNLDVVVVKLNDLINKKTEYQDYTKTTEDVNDIQDVTLEFDSNDKSSEIVNQNERNSVNPDELFAYYELFKARTINKLINFVLYQKDDIDISQLSKRQQEVIKDMQEEIPKLRYVDTGKLEERLVSLLFGPESEALVLPHGDNNYNIYVPQWVYNNLRSDQPRSTQTRQSGQSKTTRRPSAFPLTKYQKLKLQKVIQKQQRQEAAKKPELWRRSLSEDLQSYGTPFELDIQGLGQVNA